MTVTFQMGDPSVEVTEENRDASQMAKIKAMDAISEGNIHCKADNADVCDLFIYLFFTWQSFGMWMDSQPLCK